MNLMMYRCTRPRMYEPGTPGHKDVSARQGHYIRAASEHEAFLEMDRTFPEDKGKFDVQLWSEK